jgi:hypothetical protein
MKCEEFEDQLNLSLDEHRRPEWDAELRLHCENCAQCRELAALYGQLLDGFYALATPEPPADLAIRVVNEVRARPASSRRVAILTGVLATAAAVLVAVLPLLPSSANRSAKRAAAISRPALASATTGNASPNGWRNSGWQEFDTLPVVGPVLVSMSDGDESTDPYMELAKETGQGLASVVLYIPQIGSGPGEMSIATELLNGGPAWPQRMNQSLKPVTDTVGETIDLLWHALPLSDPSKRS